MKQKEKKKRKRRTGRYGNLYYLNNPRHPNRLFVMCFICKYERRDSIAGDVYLDTTINGNPKQTTMLRVTAGTRVSSTKYHSFIYLCYGRRWFRLFLFAFRLTV